VNLHNKRVDWIAAVHVWHRIGLQESPEYLEESWRRISEWKNKRPGCSPALEREAESEGNQQTAVNNLSHEPYPQSTATPNNSIRVESEPTAMGIKKSDAFPKKYLKVDDLDGRRVSAVIGRVTMEEVGDKDKGVLYFKNDDVKPLVLNLTNWSMIEEIAGTEDTDKWPGIKIVLYPSKTDFNGRRVPCIRIDAPKPSKPSREPGEDYGEEAA
jgi:hypothetical protein